MYIIYTTFYVFSYFTFINITFRSAVKHRLLNIAWPKGWLVQKAL